MTTSGIPAPGVIICSGDTLECGRLVDRDRTTPVLVLHVRVLDCSTQGREPVRLSRSYWGFWFWGGEIMCRTDFRVDCRCHSCLVVVGVEQQIFCFREQLRARTTMIGRRLNGFVLRRPWSALLSKHSSPQHKDPQKLPVALLSV